MFSRVFLACLAAVGLSFGGYAYTGSGESEVHPIETIAPVFSDFAVLPAQASGGDIVTITFSVSETLAAHPTVTVGGHDALYVSGGKAAEDYTYQYYVEMDDLGGMAVVLVTGSDALGNSGLLVEVDSLEITNIGPVPVRAWLVGLVLFAVAILVISRRRRAAALTMVLLLLAAPAAVAANPAVSNVTFVQEPNGNDGTQVVISYDLDAPNGPCDITVLLSKGPGGFVHPVTSITGDVSGVATGDGYEIVWDIRADYPEQDIPLARVRITADDGVGDLHTYYRDDDGDTYGQDGDFVSEFEPAIPYTATIGGDCNDDDADINPGASEICNMIDDNCNGETDEGFDRMTDPQNCGMCGNECEPGQICEVGMCVDQTKYYRDDDNDTYGQDDDFVYAAEPADPYTATQGGDCMDADPDINPGATEICNEIDDDCDGTLDEGFNLMIDNSNCGACGNECAPGQSCVAGECQ
jgi:hypothetical protein